MTRRRIVGVLGGMGPLATVDLYRKVVEATPARTDQEHLHVIIDADPSIPDRTEALLRGGADPVPQLIAGGQRLAAAGAAFIIMPCNTAHAFLDRVQPQVPIPFVSMIDETARAVATLVDPGAPVGILATEGTLSARLYHDAFAAVGLEPRQPSPAAQAEVNGAIAAVKRGDTSRAATERVLIAARELIDGGAQALIAACTELPLILQQPDVPVPLIDPTTVLAQAAVRTAQSTAAPTDAAQPEAAGHARRS